MANVFVASISTYERTALRLLLENIGMKVIGEADDWRTVLLDVPQLDPDILMIDWDLIARSGSNLFHLRTHCSSRLKIILVSSLSARQQAAASAAADVFVSRDDTPEQVAHSVRMLTSDHMNLM